MTVSRRRRFQKKTKFCPNLKRNLPELNRFQKSNNSYRGKEREEELTKPGNPIREIGNSSGEKFNEEAGIQQGKLASNTQKVDAETEMQATLDKVNTHKGIEKPQHATQPNISIEVINTEGAEQEADPECDTEVSSRIPAKRKNSLVVNQTECAVQLENTEIDKERMKSNKNKARQGRMPKSAISEPFATRITRSASAGNATHELGRSISPVRAKRRQLDFKQGSTQMQKERQDWRKKQEQRHVERAGSVIH